jgi:hypothetical protein
VVGEKMIYLEEFKGDRLKLEQYLNTNIIRKKYKIISVQKTIFSIFGTDRWIVTFEQKAV